MKQYSKVNGQHIITKIPSLETLTKLISENPIEEFGYNHAWTSRDSWFCGNSSIEDTYKLVRTGWKEGAEKARRLYGSYNMEKLLGQIRILEEPLYDVCGEVLDIGRYCAGEPEHFYTMQKNGLLSTATEQKNIRLVMNITASGGFSTDELITRGLPVAMLCDLLEASGNRVSITIGTAITASIVSDSKMEIYTDIKPFDEPLDFDRVTFALAHPSCFRRLHFGAMAQVAKAFPNLLALNATVRSSAYGYPSRLSDNGDIPLTEAFLGRDKLATDKWIREQLESHGITIQEA